MAAQQHTGESAALGAPASGPAPTTLPQSTAAGAMLVGIALVAYGLKRTLARRARKISATQEESSASAGVDPQLVRDMRELSGRLATELDAKAERLEQLIRLADERCARLEALSRDTRVIEPKPERVARSTGLEAAHREVYELADAGLSPVEIAKKLDQPTGQIELILNLRKGTVAL